MLAWQNLPGQGYDTAAGLTLGDLAVTPLPVDTKTARMDLTFSLGELWTGDGELAGIGGTVEYRTDVFDAAGIDLLIGRLQRVLTALTAEPERSLSSVSLIDGVRACPPRRARQPGGADRADVRRSRFRSCSPGRWIRTPDTVALSYRDRSWTYAELDAGIEPDGAPAGRSGRGSGAVRGAAVPPVGRGDRLRSWRSSSLGRPICRSIRHFPRRASDSYLPTPPRSRSSPPLTSPVCSTAWTWPSSTWHDPAIDARPTTALPVTCSTSPT